MFFLKRFWLRSTTGEVILTTKSPVNGQVVVKRDLNGYRVVVGGLTQSGGQVGVIWQKALKRAKGNLDLGEPPRALLLGLGAGSNAKIVNHFWPGACLVGVELDPVMVEIGKQFFGLDQLANLQIELSDAVDYVKTQVKKKSAKFDLILIDLYLGKNYPRSAETRFFIMALKQLLADHGWVIFNRLDYGEYHRQAAKLVELINEVFPVVRHQKIGGNLFIQAAVPVSSDSSKYKKPVRKHDD